MLVQKGFESDPVAAWTKAQEKVQNTHIPHHNIHDCSRSSDRFRANRDLRQAQEEDEGNESDASLDSGSSAGPNFNYILNMPLWCLTKEKVEELLKQRDLKVIRWEGLQMGGAYMGGSPDGRSFKREELWVGGASCGRSFMWEGLQLGGASCGRGFRLALEVSDLNMATCCSAERRTERAPEEVSGGPVEGGPGGVRGGAGGTSAVAANLLRRH